jgi:hypothetical protein
MTDEEMRTRVATIEKALSATRLAVRVVALAAILGWIGCVVLWVYVTTTVPSRLVVKDSMGDTAVLDASGLRFNGPKGTPVAWFAAWPAPSLEMSVDGAPYVKLQVTTFDEQTLGQPFGALWLNAKNGQSQMFKPSPRSQPSQ